MATTLQMLRRCSLVVAAACATSCGARTGLDDGRAAGDTDAIAGDDAPSADAGPPVACPPIPTGWSPPSLVASSPTSVAMAADARCGVVIATGDAAQNLDLATVDGRGSVVHEALGTTGLVVALASTGRELHVLYNDGRALYYVVRRDGVLGPTELVDADGLARGELIVDAGGAVHAVYEAAVGPLDELRYSVRRGVWAPYERIDARQAFDPTIALGKGGALYVSYEYLSSSSDHACVLGTRTPGAASWSLVDLPRLDAHWSSSPCNVRTAADGALHLAYGGYGDEGQVIRHAYGSVDALRFENLDRLSSFGTDPKAAAVDSHGRFHVAYRSAESGTPLTIAVTVGGGASLEKVPDATSTEGALIVIDAVDVTHVTYFRGEQLWYTARGPS